MNTGNPFLLQRCQCQATKCIEIQQALYEMSSVIYRLQKYSTPDIMHISKNGHFWLSSRTGNPKMLREEGHEVWDDAQRNPRREQDEALCCLQVTIGTAYVCHLPVPSLMKMKVNRMMLHYILLGLTVTESKQVTSARVLSSCTISSRIVQIVWLVFNIIAMPFW